MFFTCLAVFIVTWSITFPTKTVDRYEIYSRDTYVVDFSFDGTEQIPLKSRQYILRAYSGDSYSDSILSSRKSGTWKTLPNHSKATD